jgi:hypothetical protein
MASFSPIKDIVEQALILDTANLNNDISKKEARLKDAAIKLGCLDYFRHFPLKTVMATAYSTNSGGVTIYDWSGLPASLTDDGNIIIPFEEVFKLATPKVPEDQYEHAYFLGVMKVERPSWNTYSNPSLWDRQMLGVQVNNSNFDIMKTLLSNTLDELSTGQPGYVINRMQNRVEVFLPWGLGLLSWQMGIGFDSPEYVEMSKADILCKFISYRFIESLIQARSGIGLSADYDIDVSALKERLGRLKEEVDSLKNLSNLKLADWA